MASGEQTPRPVNRLATPLPDSVLDRYFAEHPEEEDFRKPPLMAEDEQPLPSAEGQD